MTLALALMVAITACAPDGTDDEGLTVVATSSIWGDVVSQIVGEDATVEVLIPIGVDAHEFQISPQQVAMIGAADLVVANGLGLEGNLEEVLADAAADGANIYEVASDLDPLPFAEDQAEDGDDHGGLDPHVWFDPARMATAAGLIADRLAEVAPDVDWGKRASEYASRLETTDAEMAGLFAGLDSDKRRLVTNHEALGYLAERYGFEVIGVVIPGGSTLAQPSSAELAALVDEIENEGVNAIFAETSQSTALAEAVAAEVGFDIDVVELFTESLGEPGSEAGTLVEMLLVDARRITEALD